MINVFNIAEKPSVAKNITEIMSNKTATREFSNSRTNPVFSFKHYLEGRMCKMYFTSVRGHLMSMDFDKSYRAWKSTTIESLFTAPIHSYVSHDCKEIEMNILHYAKFCDVIVLWLDCDREGEAIAFEVLEVYKQVKKNCIIRRAIFSAVTESEIERACNNLKDPNKNLANAVETRQEIDLRIGSAFTRFLTLRYKDVIQTDTKVLSYGTCQLPTLGFVVERYILIENFQREPYWTITAQVKHEDTVVTFNWDRKKIYDHLAALTLYEACLLNPMGVIKKVAKKQVKRYPPTPLDTIEMHKDISIYLKISSSKCMHLAESLYNKGYISYPRTETTIFPRSIDLKEIIQMLSPIPQFRDYINTLLNENGFREPMKGFKNDEAHPPIHPVKCLTREEAESIEHWELYEYITRRFLACCSKPAIGHQSNVIMDISGELFSLRGLIIEELNWFDIYKYKHWDAKLIPKFVEKQQVMPDQILLKEGYTHPPPLLSESNLIDLMNKNGIGTDATMHEHIQKIQERRYCIKDPTLRFVPTNLGKAIYYGFKEYKYRNIDLTKPSLRAKMEKDMNDISIGVKEKTDVVLNYSNLIRSIFDLIYHNSDKFDSHINFLYTNRPDEAPLPAANSVS